MAGLVEIGFMVRNSNTFSFMNYSDTENQPSSNSDSKTDRIKYGERAIEEGKLITFPNPRPGRQIGRAHV